MKKIIITAIMIFAAILAYFWNVPPSGFTEDPIWSITFSHTFAMDLGLDWKKVYSDILTELKPARIRLPVYWSVVEKEEGKYDFSDYDFMMRKAKEEDVEIVLVVGRRVPRWPECHVPKWAQTASYNEQNDKLKDLIIHIVDRYKNNNILYAWQVENEPFLPLFGECPPPDGKMLDEEIRLVKFLDNSRSVIITDSGELSIWMPAYRRGDVFGTTMYRNVWSEHLSPYLGYITYPIPPKFFWFKANIARFIYGKKPIVVSELQAEPWAPGFLKNLPVKEQEKTFNLEKFYENIEYARAVGFTEVYLWGAEWWFYMKESRNNSDFWEFGKEIINGNKAL